MDNLDFLDSPEGENEAAQPEAEVTQEAPEGEAKTEAEDEKPSQPRGPDGKFASKKADEPVMVPLAALHETRDKVKVLESQLAALTQPQQQQAQVPDMFENPEGYHNYIQNQIVANTLNERLNVSEEMARQSAGEETVNAAQEWGRQVIAANPAFAQHFYAQRNPYGFLVKEFQRQQALAAVGDVDPTEIEEFRNWKAAQAAAPKVPTSLATAQSARGSAGNYQPPSLEEILGR